jgi:hypothetical protein
MLVPLVRSRALPLPSSADSRASVEAGWSALAASITASAARAAAASTSPSSRVPRIGSMPRARACSARASLRTSPLTRWPSAISRWASEPPM